MRQITLLLIVVLVTNHLSAQNYLNASARWEQSYSHMGFTSSTQCMSTLYFDGDTTVANKQYMKLYANSTCYYSHLEYDSLGNSYMLIDTNITIHALRAGIREIDKKVYVLASSGPEYLQYNFNYDDYALIDSVVAYSVCWGGSAVSLMAHDTVCIGSIARKRWPISPSSYPLAYSLIEGVGPSSGFLAPICRNGCPECGYNLLSFIMNGDTLYHGNCRPALGVGTISMTSGMHIAPNPSHDIIKLSLPVSAATVRIFDELGRQVQTLWVNSPETLIPCAEWGKGIYTIQAINGQVVFSERVVVY